MGRIAVLTEELINKIAAGEVVERPASVVKELAENSVDAGALNVRISLRSGGRSLIAVADDGCGMSREDAAVSLQRHATSKLRDLEGLWRIASKGFRGEALPAIASVSRFTLVTSEPDAKVGTCIRLEGGGPLECTDAAPAGGTSVRVEDLFFNVPARRKFLRSHQTELGQVRDAVVRLALAHPEVGFFLENDDLAMIAAPASPEPAERIASLFGPEVHAQLVPVEESRLGARVTGYVGLPEFSLSTGRGVYTFVNRRYVRDRGLNHAIQRAFRDVLPPGRHPMALLFIEMDPRAADVNVHPQKLEVRFADPPSTHDAVFCALRRALGAANAAFARPGGDVPGASYALAVESFLDRARRNPEGPLSLPGVGERPGFGQARPGLNEAPPPGYFSSLRYLGTLAGRFLVCEAIGGSLVAIDPHAALERICFCALRAALDSASRAPRQRFLFPATVTLDARQSRVLAENAPLLDRLNLEVEPFGAGSVALRAVPTQLFHADHALLLRELADALSSPGGSIAHPDRVLQITACHAASLPSRSMSREEIDSIFAQLDESDFDAPCIHAAVVVLDVPLLDIGKRQPRTPPHPAGSKN